MKTSARNYRNDQDIRDARPGPYVAIKDVNARSSDGEFVCILGHSGCGKSTVLSIIAGLQNATFGGVVIDGKEVDEPGTDRGVVFQSPCLLPWLTAARKRAAGGRAWSTRTPAKVDARSRTTSNWSAWRTPPIRMPAELSLGTQQCVSLARALSIEPKFLLLDEPFSMLDSLTRLDLQDTLLRGLGDVTAGRWSW